jgi:hypothetical protein
MTFPRLSSEKEQKRIADLERQLAEEFVAQEQRIQAARKEASDGRNG